ncbi:MAG TPA: CsbD family protein [Verrucomicrobiae bacterium]
MSTLAAKGTWNIAKGKLKQTFARFMHDDLQFIEGKVDELVGRIQKRKAESRNRIERAADNADECGCSHR